MTSYWNHNSAYHPLIMRLAARAHGRILDVGCGEGLLVERLAAVSTAVVGIDPDLPSIVRGRERVDGLTNVALHAVDLGSYSADFARFDLIVFVASIHHMDLEAALISARSLLAPGGEIVVIGLAANKTALDWIISGALLPVVRIPSWAHRETRDIGVPTALPREGLREIRAVAARVLPGARVQRGLYYRYILRWRNSD